MKQVFYILGICSILLVACKPGIDPTLLSKIDNLEKRADSSLTQVLAIDTAKGLAATNHFFENMQYIQQEMKDTIDAPTAQYIDNYYGMRKAFKLFGNEYPNVLLELQACKKQIENLKHDAEANILEEAEAQKYFQLESNNLSYAEESAAELLYAINTVQPIYDTMNPKIDSIILHSRQNQTVQ